MTLKNTYKLTGFLFIFIFVALGCGPKGTITEETRDVGTDRQVDRTKENVLDLSSDKLVIPVEHPKSGAIKGKAVLGSNDSELEDSVYTILEDIPDEVDSLNSQSYRVQLFSSKVFGESRQAKRIAEEIFDRPVFMDYEVPYYKVRVGNFSNREKAEEYQLRAKSAGYTNAWVVVVTIDVQEMKPMYDGMIKPILEDSSRMIDNEN